MINFDLIQQSEPRNHTVLNHLRQASFKLSQESKCAYCLSPCNNRPGQQLQWKSDILLQADLLCFITKSFHSPSHPPLTHSQSSPSSMAQHLCDEFQVHLEFSEKQMHPASNVSLVIEAAANSFCAVRAVDQSVLLLKPETELSVEMVSFKMPCLPPLLLPPPLQHLSTWDHQTELGFYSLWHVISHL